MNITSTNNELIKYFVKLRNIKNIKEEKKYIVETPHLVLEALKCGIVEEIIMLEGEYIPKEYNVKVNIVNEKVMKKISTLDTPSSIMAVCKVEENDTLGEKIVLLDDVRDPGNVGTIIRNCVAFGVDTIILSKNSVNKYNDKLIRSTQGMFFKVNIIEEDIIDAINRIKEDNIKVIGTSLKGFSELKCLNKDKSYAIVFGNESKGISEEVEVLCDELVYISINSSCESLNVACASAIILHYMED